MKGDISELMQQAQNMQAELKKAQDGLAAAEVQGEAGAGLVCVVMTGRHDIKRVSIDDSVFLEDKEVLKIYWPPPSTTRYAKWKHVIETQCQVWPRD